MVLGAQHGNGGDPVDTVLRGLVALQEKVVLLDAELAALLGKWKVLSTTELAALNAELAKAGISAIAVK